ncbi:uncharacterized protein I303_107647 [Kwoniella dejecticola CBS 10117]|uniref:Stc1 domain-containing protein n=1 Tax=Kwoniella dejecticola CBS 10117 TaxID=1296121 RepID=A0A1A5ZVB5_9TREE|nr:uncharacterized protein I303_07658 [Kwoniella dejecticola CBS 10117]OBR81748.1 hypothetical protein I303_07658 [Kwoniella dejecticola CBS 10117]
MPKQLTSTQGGRKRLTWQGTCSGHWFDGIPLTERFNARTGECTSGVRLFNDDPVDLCGNCVNFYSSSITGATLTHLLSPGSMTGANNIREFRARTITVSCDGCTDNATLFGGNPVPLCAKCIDNPGSISAWTASHPEPQTWAHEAVASAQVQQQGWRSTLAQHKQQYPGYFPRSQNGTRRVVSESNGQYEQSLSIRVRNNNQPQTDAGAAFPNDDGQWDWLNQVAPASSIRDDVTQQDPANPVTYGGVGGQDARIPAVLPWPTYDTSYSTDWRRP